MKKLYYLIILTVILSLVLTGCLLSNVGQVPTTEQSKLDGIIKTNGTNTGPVTLFAGQDIPVGTVTVSNDDTNLYVTYETTGDWVMTETHLEVVTDPALFPMTRTGNPKVGKFPYSTEHDPDVTTYTDTISMEWIPLEVLFIAAHAVVKKTTVAPYYALVVVDSSQGLTKGGVSVRWQRSTPEQGLIFETSKDEENFFSLGFGGRIIVEFDSPIQNGDGNDVKIIEDTWGGRYPLETADIFASKDGTNWIYLGEADNTNLDVIHTISEFDLGILSWAKYIKIEDTSDPTPHNNAADGYDLNAVEALHDYIQEETAWGDGDDFDGRNWATYFTYTVQ